MICYHIAFHRVLVQYSILNLINASIESVIVSELSGQLHLLIGCYCQKALELGAISPSLQCCYMPRLGSIQVDETAKWEQLEIIVIYLKTLLAKEWKFQLFDLEALFNFQSVSAK